MRIQHHFSIILFVAVVGAIGLAAAVAVLLGGLERAALAVGTAAVQQQNVGMLVAEGRALKEATEAINPKTPEEGFAIVDRSMERSSVHLANLAPTSPAINSSALDAALEALHRTQQLAKDRSAGLQHPDDLDRLRAAAADYVRQLQSVEQQVDTAVRREARALDRRRRLIMLAIGVFGFAYLAVMERLRHWTARHLIDPIQRLSDAARDAIQGRSAEPAIHNARTEELRTLAGMLTSFTDAVNSNVAQRTAQMTRQQEILEQEVRVRRRAEHELRFSAMRDKLTGLCNRDLLMDRLERCAERADRRAGYECALLCIDTDRFADVADQLGKVVGDRVVIAVADRLREGLTEALAGAEVECWTLARVGGDKFAVLLDGLKDRAHASLVADRLQEMLQRPLRAQDRDVRVSASTGIAFRDPDDTANDILRNAEAAMHYAMAAGKGTFAVFRRDMHDQVTDRQQRAASLLRAIESNEFTVAYQPIVSLRTGQLSGFEALCRWDQPGRGPVSPVEFIADAEETGAIVVLGRWVLDKACEQLRAWRAGLPHGPPISMSVNVSRQQLAHPDFVDEVRNALRATGIEPSCLKLEITESVIMDNPDAVAEVLRNLKALGVEIHMDDFGTGYSSLSYLHRLPIDVLKIDRTFMTTLSANNESAEVIQTVVALARTLRMGVTVEGVEEQEQLDQVKTLECDYAQGFFFSRPLDAAAAWSLVRSRRRWLRAAA
jgi:diguanylate cyclase (GGDEF)-like protein